MHIKIFKNKEALGKASAEHAAGVIRRTILERGGARIVAATGASQKDFLAYLTSAPGIDWHLVELFHLDEYIGLPITHPASFRKILLEHLIGKTGIVKHHLLDGDDDVTAVMARAGAALASAPIDVAFVGIGENGHLAFNDPPADFNTDKPYLIVNLDEACRRQQVGEGWFPNISQVPQQAISMSVRQIMKAKEIVAIVPDARKAAAVQRCLEGEIDPKAPASILRNHPKATVYLDINSAALLNPERDTSTATESL